MVKDEGEEKTPTEDQTDETTEEQEEDPFADIFGDEEQEESDDTSKKPDKKPQKIAPKVNVRQIIDDRFTESEKRLERRADINDFLASDEGKMFSKYGSEIRKAALDPRFINIPISQLPGVILKPSVYSKVLEDAREEANREAEDSYIGGSKGGAINTPEELTKIDPLSMAKEEFNTLKNRALRGEFLIKNK